MTANVRIQVDRREDVLRVPTAALRFRPPTDGADAPAGAPRPRASAEDPAAGRGAAGAAPATGGGQGGGRGGSLREMRANLARDLALTPEQLTKLDAILEEARQAFAAARVQGGDDAGPGAQRRRARTEVREKIRAILTPDQQKRFDATVAAQDGGSTSSASPARVFVPGTDGKPRAVGIMVGLSDGAFSEVVSGELQAGQEVLVGTPTGTSGRPPAQGGPRLRF
jgi:HlyD family secretion protein